MKCPTDDTQLVIAERQGIEIDFCPTCRGVWLDRGELDKILERTAQAQAPKSPAPHRDPGATHPDGAVDQGRHPRKRKSLLGELFDF